MISTSLSPANVGLVFTSRNAALKPVSRAWVGSQPGQIMSDLTISKRHKLESTPRVFTPEVVAVGGRFEFVTTNRRAP